MKLETRTVEIRRWTSDVCPEITTDVAGFADVIAWGDAHPKAWKIVMGAKSQAFGRTSGDYYGYQRGPGIQAILERLEKFRSVVEDDYPNEFFVWRARYVLEHYGQKGYTGGLFQEHCVWEGDGKEYPRHGAVLDYTPETLEAVIDRFVAWCDDGPCRYDGRTRITVDGRDVRTFR